MTRADADQTVEALLTRLHDGVVHGNIEAVMACFHRTARLRDNLESGFATGLDEIRAYYLRQFATVRIDASMLSLLRHDAQMVEALVQVTIQGVDGGFWWNGPIGATYHLCDGLITGIDIDDNPADGGRQA